VWDACAFRQHACCFGGHEQESTASAARQEICMSFPTRSQDDSEAAAAARKQITVDAKELDWVNHHLREDKQAEPAGGGGGGFLRAMIDTIIGNLQLSITNVHVRYEVRPACGLIACDATQEVVRYLLRDAWRRRLCLSCLLNRYSAPMQRRQHVAC